MLRHVSITQNERRSTMTGGCDMICGSQRLYKTLQYKSKGGEGGGPINNRV